ncbi:MAG: hypothetical protein SH850_14130 [Planctomycetaceae bacterium]|nr:hypothetical protein [Planctomycetaceae bacterium]
MMTWKQIGKRWVTAFGALALLCGSFASFGQEQAERPVKRADQVSRERARELFEKSNRGEKLTADEQTELDRARQQRRKGTARVPANSGDAKSATPTGGKTTAGLVPLTELSASDKYKGEDGGLYGGGKNEPPETQRLAAQKELAKIVPLDANGQPAQDGKIVLLSIGMSNTTLEFSAFQKAANADSAKNPRLVIVDGAQGGQGAAEWTEGDGEKTWNRVAARLKQADVAPTQVQVIWLKQAVKRPKPGEELQNARALQAYLVTILHTAKTTYPNLRIAYLSSRSYGGFSTRHGEPESYETALSVRWVIQDQLAGKPALNHDPARGDVKAPLLLWGPYLWSDGSTPRQSDALVWTREDFVADGTHPSDSGRQKAVDLLLKFFKTDPLAKAWFLKP